MQKIISKWQKFTPILLLFCILSVLIIGCSTSTTAKADINEKLELAVKYLSENKYQEAIITYRDAIKIDSKNVIAYKGLSLAYQLSNKTDLAQEALEDGLKVVTQTSQLKLMQADLMMDQGEADNAEAIFKELVSSDNPTYIAYQAYTYYLNRQGKQQEAINLLEQAVAKNKTDYKLNSMLAELYYENGDQEKALAAITNSMTNQVDQSVSYKLLAEIYQNKWSDQIALGDQFIKQNHVQTGQTLKLSGLFNMGKYDDVIKQYEVLTKDIKDEARVRLIVAQAYLKLNKKDLTSELLKPINVTQLKDSGMLADLADLYLQTGDKNKARKLAEQGINLDESLIDNYLVMYKSYEGEDKKSAQVWAYKYLISSSLSCKDSLNALSGVGIDLEQSKDSVTGESVIKERIQSIIFTPESVEPVLEELKLPGKDWTHNHLACYLDTSKDIAYYGYMVSQNDTANANLYGKSIVARVHNPKIVPISEIPGGEQECYVLARKVANEYKTTKAMRFNTHAYHNPNVDYYLPVIIEGNDFEGDLMKAGIPKDFVVYVDK